MLAAAVLLEFQPSVCFPLCDALFSYLAIRFVLSCFGGFLLCNDLDRDFRVLAAAVHAAPAAPIHTRATITSQRPPAGSIDSLGPLYYSF